jgi:hypothetical protein
MSVTTPPPAHPPRRQGSQRQRIRRHLGRELVEGLINIAALLCVDFGGEWHAWPGAHKAFAAAVAQRLSAYAPGPGMVVDPELGIQEDEVEITGRMRERDDRRAHDYRHLKVAQGFYRRPPKKSGSDE